MNVDRRHRARPISLLCVCVCVYAREGIAWPLSTLFVLIYIARVKIVDVARAVVEEMENIRGKFWRSTM